MAQAALGLATTSPLCRVVILTLSLAHTALLVRNHLNTPFAAMGCGGVAKEVSPQQHSHAAGRREHDSAHLNGYEGPRGRPASRGNSADARVLKTERGE